MNILNEWNTVFIYTFSLGTNPNKPKNKNQTERERGENMNLQAQKGWEPLTCASCYRWGKGARKRKKSPKRDHQSWARSPRSRPSPPPPQPSTPGGPLQTTTSNLNIQRYLWDEKTKLQKNNMVTATKRQDSIVGRVDKNSPPDTPSTSLTLAMTHSRGHCSRSSEERALVGFKTTPRPPGHRVVFPGGLLSIPYLLAPSPNSQGH